MSGARLRLALFYAAYFSVIGVAAPYWPVWLKAQGMGPGEIGVLLSAVLWVKVLANPLLAQAADRRRARRGFMLALALIALAGYAGYTVLSGFWCFLALGLVVGVAFSAILPLGDALALARVYAQGLDYGRVRLWGSITFILASVGIGQLLPLGGEGVVLWALIVFVAGVIAAAAGMPEAHGEAGRAAGGTIRLLLAQPVFLLFLLVTSMNQASHAVLYGFATLHWRASGIDDGMIGLLWAEGVVAEIILFSQSNLIVRHVGVVNLLLLATAAAAIRWLAFGLSAALPVLIAGQALHGLSFGAAHLAAMHFVARAVPPEMTATAQSLNAALAGGVASGSAILLAGWLYGQAGGRSFLAMAVLALVALAAALLLRRRWQGARL